MKTILKFNSLPTSLSDKIILIIKISVISFVAMYLFGNFIPFYEGNDSYTLSTVSIYLSQNNFITSNELLEKTGRIEFIPGDWFQTIDRKNIFPGGPIGFHYFISLLYIVGNNFALFYFGPALGIIFLVISERITTKLFDKYVGLLTLLFLSTNHLFFRSSLNLNVDILFSLFFVIGCYFFIRFLKNFDSNKILLASLFFVFGTFVRINGIIFLPIEIFLLMGFLIFNKFSITYSKNLKLTIKNHEKIKLNKKKFIQISILLIIPWIGFLSFWFGYNEYFFDDPLTNYAIEQRGYENTDAKISSLWTIESKHFENFKQYSKYLLPYQFPATEKILFDQFNNIFGTFWLGLLSITILFSSLIISIKIRCYRTELIVFTVLILGTIWFFSSVTSEERALDGVPGRYVMSAFTIFFMVLGYLLITSYRESFKLIKSKFWLGRCYRFLLVLSLGLFFTGSIFFIPPTELIKSNSFEFKNPFDYTYDHPPNSEGLTQNNVILAIKTDRILEYDVIPFHMLPFDEGDPKDSIELLKEIILVDYDVFIFKKSTTSLEKQLLNTMIEEHNFVLKDHSKSFCKIFVLTNMSKITSDNECLLD
jgi:hypothetical protein